MEVLLPPEAEAVGELDFPAQPRSLITMRGIAAHEVGSNVAGGLRVWTDESWDPFEVVFPKQDREQIRNRAAAVLSHFADPAPLTSALVGDLGLEPVPDHIRYALTAFAEQEIGR